MGENVHELFYTCGAMPLRSSRIRNCLEVHPRCISLHFEGLPVVGLPHKVKFRFGLEAL
jgi:hypothetical protein